MRPSGVTGFSVATVIKNSATETLYIDGAQALHDPAPLAGPVKVARLGIENMATTCVQGRAVMIDLEAAFGPGRRLVGYQDLAVACARQNVVVESGDMVCLHTGFATALVAMGAPQATAVLGVVAWRLFEYWAPIPLAGVTWVSLRLQVWFGDSRGRTPWHGR